jgi:hypothetical protein
LEINLRIGALACFSPVLGYKNTRPFFTGVRAGGIRKTVNG